MKRITTSIFGLILTTTLTAVAAYGQNNPSPSPQNLQPASPQKAINSNAKEDFDIRKLEEKELLPIFLLILSLGGIGGIVFELINLQGNIEWPHKPSDDELAAKLAYATPKNVIDLGILARIIIGAMAAPPAMLFFRPESLFALIAMSVVAGSAGTAVFRGLQDRLLLVVAQKEKSEKEEQFSQLIAILDKTILELEQDKYDEAAKSLKKAKEFRAVIALQQNSKQAVSQANLQDKVDKTIEAFQNLKDKLIKVSESPEGHSKLKFTGEPQPFIFGVSIKQEDLDSIGNLLSEIKGIYDKVVSPTDNIAKNIAQVEQAMRAFEELKKKIIDNSSRPSGKITLEPTKGTSLEQADLDNLEKLLSKLKGNLSTG